MKFKISLFSAIALIVLTIGTNQIIKADAINSSDDTTQTTPIKGVIGSKGLGEDGKIVAEILKKLISRDH